jgi:choice-of-anchor B domain-containing protein
MRFLKTLPVFLLSILFFASNCLGHADHEKARFVAFDGIDIGKCDNPEKPCKTVSYAGLKSNKGDKILLSEGNYVVDDVDTLFYLLSDLVPVEGSYSKSSNYRKKHDSNITRLIGVPLEFADKLGEKGFTVVVDSKALDVEKTALIRQKVALFERLSLKKEAATCDFGMAGDHPCDNMDLLAHVPLSDFSINPSAANDIWGFYDLNDNKEYAIIGLRNGIGVVEVTDPTLPRVVGSISSQSTAWRDLKVYQYFDHEDSSWKSYAYVTADSASVGTMVVDLRGLPESISAGISGSNDVSAHNVYLSNVDYATGVALTGMTPYLHIAGSNQQGGSFNTYGLDNPQQPNSVYLNESSSRGNYSHDVSSMIVTDERKDTQCVLSQAFCEIFFDFNENNFQIWDKTNNNSPTRLSTTAYQYVSYVHSGWYTEDKQVVLVHDELDEMDYGLNTTVRLFELSDFRAPSLLSTWTGPTRAIDHNGFVRGNRYYMSNYTRGVTVIDISDPQDPRDVGFFDTFPVADNVSFNGAWGVYPYLPSGNILVSDISSGLYIVKDNTKQPSQGNFSFDSLTHHIEEGSVLFLNVNRVGGFTGDVSVGWELIMGALDSNDIENASGVLNWNDGENASKTIELQILGDSVEESNESFMVRLFDPKNGAALGKHNMAVISVIDKATADIEISAGEDQIVNAGELVQLQGTLTGANSDEVTYEWTQSSGNSVQIAQDGDGSAEFVAPSSAGILQFSFTASISNGGSYSDQTNVTIVVDNNSGTSSGGGGCTVSTNKSTQPLLLFLMLIFSIVFITNKKYAYIRIAKR